MVGLLKTGLWANGQDECLKALAEAEARELQPLLAALEQNKVEQQELKRRMAEVKAIFKSKRKEVRGFLFVR